MGTERISNGKSACVDWRGYFREARLTGLTFSRPSKSVLDECIALLSSTEPSVSGSHYT
jgi:hypothetical protein